jgi:uncharacterized membrane protein YfhO
MGHRLLIAAGLCDGVSVIRGISDSEDMHATMDVLRALGARCDKVGDVVTVRLTCKANEKGTMTLTAAVLNNDLFRRGHDILRASTLELTDFSNTRVTGTINCDRDGLLYASIPQNGNWSVLVDGEETEIQLVGDCMLGVSLIRGQHTVEYVYRNPAFSAGWKITLGCAAVFLVLYLVVYKPQMPKHTKGRFEK